MQAVRLSMNKREKKVERNIVPPFEPEWNSKSELSFWMPNEAMVRGMSVQRVMSVASVCEMRRRFMSLIDYY